jgi:hypothetical protein
MNNHSRESFWNNPGRSSSSNNDDEEQVSAEDAKQQNEGVAIAREGNSTTLESSSSTSHSQTLQQLPQNASLDLLSALGIPLPAASAFLASSHIPPGPNLYQNPTALPAHSQHHRPELFPGTQNNPQAPLTLLLGIQHLLQQLSDNLSRRGLDAATTFGAGGNPAGFHMGLGMTQPPQQQLHFQQLPQNATQSLQQHQPSSSLNIPPSILLASVPSGSTLGTIVSQPPPPPIHPGATKNPPTDVQPDYTTTPCRARGMPSDHNSQVRLKSIHGIEA